VYDIQKLSHRVLPDARSPQGIRPRNMARMQAAHELTDHQLGGEAFGAQRLRRRVRDIRRRAPLRVVLLVEGTTVKAGRIRAKLWPRAWSTRLARREIERRLTGGMLAEQRRRLDAMTERRALKRAITQSTAWAASQLHLPRRGADSPAPPSRQIKHRKRLAQLHGGPRSAVRCVRVCFRVKPPQKRKRSVSSACRCTPIGAMIGGWRSKQNKCPLAA